jgi:hypothetical protein
VTLISVSVLAVASSSFSRFFHGVAWLPASVPPTSCLSVSGSGSGSWVHRNAETHSRGPEVMDTNKVANKEQVSLILCAGPVQGQCWSFRSVHHCIMCEPPTGQLIFTGSQPNIAAKAFFLPSSSSPPGYGYLSDG